MSGQATSEIGSEKKKDDERKKHQKQNNGHWPAGWWRP